MASRVPQFLSLVARQPDNELFRFSLAQALIADARGGEALSHLEACVAKRPDWMVARILLGKCLHSAGRAAEARREFESALSLAIEQQHEEPERELRALLSEFDR